MLNKDWKDELLGFLKRNPKHFNVVVMPDFFCDRLISLNYETKGFFELIGDVAKRKGGSIDGIPQIDIKGGNAINVTSALAVLGVKVAPIVCTNKFGLKQLNFFLGEYNVELSHVKIMKKASLTTALELKDKNGKTNVMLRDVGSLIDFGPSDLTDCDYELIENADYVCLFNWAGTRKYGTALAETIFRRVKTKGKGKTYYDTADPTPNRDKIPELMREVLNASQVDVLSLNENEVICYAEMLNDEIREQQGKRRLDELAMEAARFLSKNLSARIDLHTTVFSATFLKKREVVVPAFKVNGLRATGAGDAWNAGNIFGDANGLSDQSRLALANAVSACYLASPEGLHPTRSKLIKFIEKATESF
jgi:sugar/nucleoside kinase (ribokinase family)